ncbi:MAG: glycosyltransferase [Nitrososphaerales archaeon]
MKICIICFDFKKENINKQPWRFIYELGKGIAQRGLELIILSNSKFETNTFEGLTVYSVKRLSSWFGWSKEALEKLKTIKPDVAIVVLGVASLLKPKLKLGLPAICVLTSPIYDLKDVFKPGLIEMIRHFRYLFIHFIGAIIPPSLIRRRLNSFDHIVVLSEANKRKLVDYGVHSARIKVIPQGISESDLQLPEDNEVNKIRKDISPEDASVILYFGPPLTLRGTDILIKAFVDVSKNFFSKLILLARVEDKASAKEIAYLKNIISKTEANDRVRIITHFLASNEIRKYVRAADVVCLPFKLVISDVPITILEAMLLGKPIISTDLNGIPELLDARGLIVKSNDYIALRNSLIALLTNTELAKKLGYSARNYMSQYYPRWNKICDAFVGLVQMTINRLRNNIPSLIFIIGPDGVGKTTQAKILVKVLRNNGIPAEYVWMRWNHKLSLMILALARLLFLTRIERLGNRKRLAYHYFNRIKPVALIYSYTVVFDTLFSVFTKIYLRLWRGKYVICDRSPYDTLVDLMVSTRNPNLLHSFVGKLLLRVANKAAIVMLTARPQVLKTRRIDVYYDKDLELKVRFYDELSKILRPNVVNAEGDVVSVHSTIVGILCNV